MTTKAKKPDIESATEELRALMQEAEKLIADKGEQADEQAARLTDRLNDALENGREKALQAKAVAEERLHQCDDYVRSHPYHAVGIAAGVGALVALVASSRRAAA